MERTVSFKEGDIVRINDRMRYFYPEIAHRNGTILVTWVEGLYMVDFFLDDGQLHFFGDDDLERVGMVTIGGSTGKITVGSDAMLSHDRTAFTQIYSTQKLS